MLRSILRSVAAGLRPKKRATDENTLQQNRTSLLGAADR